MTASPLPVAPWTDRLAFEVALCLEGSGEPLHTVLAAHSLRPDDLFRFLSDSLFLRKIAELQEEIRTKGVTFRLKARAQAEALLDTSWQIIHDIGVSPAVKADLIKSTVKWAGLEPRPENETNLASGGVRVTINLGDKSTTLDVASVPALEHDGDSHAGADA